jgi:uncharacterized iron-regulated membrane protein
MDLRNVILVTHRWLGLASSAFLAIAGGTGVLLIWRGRPFWEQSEWLLWAGRVSGPIHEHLAMGRIGMGRAGSLVVVTATGLAILIELGGLVLWWRKKILWVRPGRGWWRTCFEIHHLVGLIFLPLMLLLAVTGFAMGILDGEKHAELWRFLARLHKGNYPFPVDALYAMASLGFVVQGVTGLAVWWRPTAANKVRREADEPARSEV